MRALSSLLLCFSALGGCAMPGHQVYVASDTSLGVLGSMNSAQTAGKLIVGYDRAFVSLVPKTESGSDVVSVYNCTNLEIRGLRIAHFYERVATGKAAQAVVAALDREQESDSACAMK